MRIVIAEDSALFREGLASLLADAGNEVVLYARRPEVCEAINEKRENPDYLPGIELPEGVRATTDPAEALRDASYVVLAMPSQHLRENLAAWVDLIPDDAVLVSLMKGVELGTLKRMSEVMRSLPSEETGSWVGPSMRFAVVCAVGMMRMSMDWKSARYASTITRRTRCARPPPPVR